MTRVYVNELIGVSLLTRMDRRETGDPGEWSQRYAEVGESTAGANETSWQV